MKRKRRTGKQRLGILRAHGCACYLCGGTIHETEGFELEHVVPLELSKDDSDENLRPVHKKCHAKKTALDLAVIAKAKRVEIAHHGAKAPKQKIKSRPFQKTAKPEKLPLPRRARPLYVRTEP